MTEEEKQYENILCEFFNRTHNRMPKPTEFNLIGELAKKYSNPVEAGVIKKNADGLLPCPFCARTNMEIIEWNKGLFSISCTCGCESPKDSKSKDGIKRIWNRRRC